MELSTLTAADVARVPWANGLGWTRELARAGGAEWSWRISLAESTAPADFSDYAGVERVLFLTRGDCLTLAFTDGEEAMLVDPADHLRFSGNRRVRGTPGAGGTEQLNLMWRPDRAFVDWSVLRGSRVATAGPGPGATRLWHVVEGSLRVGDLDVDAGTTVVARAAENEAPARAVAAGTVVELTLIAHRTAPATARSVAHVTTPLQPLTTSSTRKDAP